MSKLTSSFQKIYFFGSIALLNLGTVLIFNSLYSGGFWFQNQQAAHQLAAITNEASHVKLKTLKQGQPVEVELPSLGINLPVKKGNFDTTSNTWNIDMANAFYATPSAPVNDSTGTSLIYGHNINAIFGKLPNLASGAELTVKTDSGYSFRYTYLASQQVPPGDVTIFSYTGRPTVTLQTCSGDWNQYRQLYSFRLEKVSRV